MTGREEKVGRYRGDAHRVRPTASWAALGVLVLGVAVVGVGVLLMSWPLAAAGAAVGVAGAAMAAWSGLLWNVHGTTGASRTTRQDGTVEVAGTHAHLEDEAAQRHAAEVSRRAQSLERQGPPRRPGLGRAGAALLLATGTWLALSQWTLYAETPEGREGTWRAMGAAIAVTTASTGPVVIVETRIKLSPVLYPATARSLSFVRNQAIAFAPPCKHHAKVSLR